MLKEGELRDKHSTTDGNLVLNNKNINRGVECTRVLCMSSGHNCLLSTASRDSLSSRAPLIIK